jgi:Reverse transcriptase (RNA-dependent DNA polymerase)
MGIKIAIFPDVFQNVISKLTQDIEYDKIYLDDLLILSNNNFKDHLLKLQIVLARLSTACMRVSTSKSKFFAKQIEYLGIGYRNPDKVFSQYTIKLKPYSMLRLQKPERNYANLFIYSTTIATCGFAGVRF